MNRDNPVLGAGSAIFLFGAGVVSLLVQFFYFPTDTQTRDWKPAADYILEHFDKETDLLRVEPNWRVDALTYFESIGSKISRQKNPVFEDLYTEKRIWLISEKDRLNEGLNHLPFEIPKKKLEIKTFGSTKVADVPIPEAPKIEYELLFNLEDAKVQRLDKNGEVTQRCTNWDDDEKRWDCGSRDKYLYVGAEYVEVGGNPHRCIWAHPLPDGKTLRITFPNIPGGQKLWLRFGLNIRATVSDRGKPVDFSASLNGRNVLAETIPPRKTSWKRDIIDLEGQASHSLTLEVHSEKVFERYFCLNGWVVSGVGSGESGVERD